MKIKYQTLENRVRKKSNPGTKKVPRYVRKIDKFNQPTMIIKEQFELYLDIQTYKDDNNISKLLEKVGGDATKLDRNQQIYLDLRNIPDNYNDIMNQRTDIFSDYLKLPIDFKKKIENNFDIYYGLVMNGKIEDIIKKFENNELTKNDIIKNTNQTNKTDQTNQENKKEEKGGEK